MQSYQRLCAPGCRWVKSIGWTGWQGERRCGDRAIALILYGAADRSQQGRPGMAQKITVALEDDLDGGPADETVRFGLGGTEYEIDLSTKNANAFRRQLAPFIERAEEHSRRHGEAPQ